MSPYSTKPARSGLHRATDKEIDARVAGNGNLLNVSYTYLPGGGKMPNIGADVQGDGNQRNIDVKPAE